MSSEDQAKAKRASGVKSAMASKEERLATLIEAARQNCVKRLVFEDVAVEFWNAGLGAPQGTHNVSSSVLDSLTHSDLPEVPERPKKSGAYKALQLNQDYDAWSAATPGPIFEKKDT